MGEDLFDDINTDFTDYACAEEPDDNWREVDNTIALADDQRIGPFTIIALVLNRMIGTGIFLTPARILRGTGSVGAALLLWAFGGVYGASGLACWLQFGLSIPYYTMPIWGKKNVPRSGGEKNYLEFLFPRPRFLATCMYGVPFIVLANLSGNAIAFGIQVMRAAGYESPPRGAVVGLAIAVLTLCTSLNIFSRRGGLVVNNFFAVVKVLTLLTIIVLGFVKAGGGLSSTGGASASDNFDPQNAFDTNRRDLPSYVHSMFYVSYSYSGFEQPFYVLSEVKSPRKTFPRYAPIAVGIAIALYMLVNIAFLCVVSKDAVLGSDRDLAEMFFEGVFGRNQRARSAMAAMIAISAFGNLLVQTFTAARVKQEIAKEGILPFAKFFATGRITPWEYLKRRLAGEPSPEAKEIDSHLEKTPMGALSLQFLSSIFLVAVTSMLNPRTAYNFLATLFSYVIMGLSGFIVSGGLLFLNVTGKYQWKEISNYRPLLGLFPSLLYFVANGFFLFSAFAQPARDSPFGLDKAEIPWYLVPTIGLSAPLWGLIWWLGLKMKETLSHQKLHVVRKPLICPVDSQNPEGEWTQLSERVIKSWIPAVVGGVELGVR
ncbi:amino acid permease-domain-containing protein [Aspergillus pseudodeflectus]|uniref:Amino acid permease-domain-containing protein n=1 Tax=Aspergillus pseudodeflectus TaxID=176178 RepID=A0ABR4KLP3_9EURO